MNRDQWIVVFDFCDISSLLSLRLVCRLFRGILQHSNAWEKHRVPSHCGKISHSFEEILCEKQKEVRTLSNIEMNLHIERRIQALHAVRFSAKFAAGKLCFFSSDNVSAVVEFNEKDVQKRTWVKGDGVLLLERFAVFVCGCHIEIMDLTLGNFEGESRTLDLPDFEEIHFGQELDELVLLFCFRSNGSEPSVCMVLNAVDGSLKELVGQGTFMLLCSSRYTLMSIVDCFQTPPPKKKVLFDRQLGHIRTGGYS